MQNVKKSFRKTEFALLVLGLIVGIISFLLLAILKKTSGEQLLGNHFDSKVLWEHIKTGLLGYFFCFLAFTLSYELFFIFEPNPKYRKWAYLFVTNLKLVIVGLLFYTVGLTGMPLANLVIGFIACQTLAVFVLLIYAYRSNNLLKARKLETDSED